jgi:drug/metabolite transporter (DMT)-like permease
VACLLAGAFTGETAVALHPTWSTVAAIAWLAIPCGVIAFTAYVYALKALPTSIVATYAFVTPLVGVAGGGLLLHERLTAQTITAMLVILVGVGLILRGRRRTPA